MSTDSNPKLFTRLLLRLRPVLKWLFKLRGSSQAVAGGLSLGIFIAFTPTIGIQVILATLLATLFNLNRSSAILSVLITNPVTIPPIFTFNYWVGTMFFTGPPVTDVAMRLFEVVRQLASFDLWQMFAQFTTFMHLGKEIMVPLTIGSIIVGSCLAAVTYAVSKRLLEAYSARRERKKLMRQASTSKKLKS